MKAIVNVSKNWGIGCKGKLLTYNKKDMANFTTLTKDNIVVMGRKTFLSLPKSQPLKNRDNIVLSKDTSLTIEGATVYNSLEDFLEFTKTIEDKDLYVIGGEIIYSMLLPYCDYAYVTKVDDIKPADTYFPNLDELANWECVNEDKTKFGVDNNLTYCIYINKDFIKEVE